MDAYPPGFGDSLVTITKDLGGLLRCETCGEIGRVYSHYWSSGWPKHCGYTMRWWTRRQLDAGEMPALTAPSQPEDAP